MMKERQVFALAAVVLLAAPGVVGVVILLRGPSEEEMVVSKNPADVVLGIGDLPPGAKLEHYEPYTYNDNSLGVSESVHGAVMAGSVFVKHTTIEETPGLPQEPTVTGDTYLWVWASAERRTSVASARAAFSWGKEAVLRNENCAVRPGPLVGDDSYWFITTTPSYTPPYTATTVSLQGVVREQNFILGVRANLSGLTYTADFGAILLEDYASFENLAVYAQIMVDRLGNNSK